MVSQNEFGLWVATQVRDLYSGVVVTPGFTIWNENFQVRLEWDPGLDLETTADGQWVEFTDGDGAQVKLPRQLEPQALTFIHNFCPGHRAPHPEVGDLAGAKMSSGQKGVWYFEDQSRVMVQDGMVRVLD